ncbi:MAG: HlyD family efflux transporter periplasmic adaptor subunit [Oscillospiraceae bacterium]
MALRHRAERRRRRAAAKGQALSLRAATGVDFDLDATVERIGREENGRVIVVLRGGSHLAYVTLLRAQNVELILARYEGLRIPKNALRVDADGSSGVYCLVGLRAYRKPVEVLWQGEDYCLVRPVGIETTSESLRQLYTLRAGDEAIVSANDLYDGKVVE